MSNTGLGYEVALGLLAGPDDFARMRAFRTTPAGSRYWRMFEQRVAAMKPDAPAEHVPADLAFAAAVTGNIDWANRAISLALKAVHEPYWVHEEAGCIGLAGMHKAQQLLLMVDWLWPLLNRDQREAILCGIMARAVENLSRAPEGIRNEDERGQLLLARRMDKDDPFCLHPLPAQLNGWDIWLGATLYLAAALAERAWLHPDPAWPALGWNHYYALGYELDQARIERWKSIGRERITSALARQVAGWRLRRGGELRRL